MGEYANPSALVETDWLEEHLGDAGIRVIEVDEDTTAYEKGHISGAVSWNWSTDLHAPVGRDYVDQDGLSQLLGQTGATADTRSPPRPPRGEVPTTQAILPSGAIGSGRRVRGLPDRSPGERWDPGVP